MMYKWIPGLLLGLPLIVHAQGYQGMSEADMQSMMQNMEKMQSCMQNINMEEIEALEKRSKQMETEVKSLCAAGKRDEAQKKAMAFGKEVSASTTVQTMKKCGEMMQGAMQNMPFAMEDTDDEKRGHICDDGNLGG